MELYTAENNVVSASDLVRSKVVTCDCGSRFIHLNLSCRTSKWEAKTRHGVNFVIAHVTTLEEILKQQPVCQDSTKDVLYDSSLEIELAILFSPNYDPQYMSSPQQPQLASRGLLMTDLVILNHGQVTWTTPELAAPLLTTTPQQQEKRVIHTNKMYFRSPELVSDAPLQRPPRNKRQKCSPHHSLRNKKTRFTSLPSLLLSP
ncbi:uncharacterized protein TNCV_3626011 [Trichonephila clavipes]|nr:uncharacterized protein TNCV_3626011 [Trichonephila clavipes]